MRATHSDDLSTLELQDEARARAGRRVGDRWQMIQGLHRGQEALLVQRFTGGRVWRTEQAIEMADPWHVVGANGEPAFQNGWANLGGAFATLAFRRRRGSVEVRGSVSAGAIGAVAFTLPEGYRPLATVGFAPACSVAPAYVNIDAVGNLLIGGAAGVPAAGVSLDAISFPTD